jgi:CBS domain-containing protein
VLQPKSAKEIMVTKLVKLSPDNDVYDGITRLLKHNITGAPVVDRDHNFLGVFSEKCCLSVFGMLARSGYRNSPESSVTAKDFMTKKLFTLSKDSDVFDSIAMLLANRISGAPVLDAEGNFLGVFSEKDSMRVLISAAYDQLPTTHVEALMNRDHDRVISADCDLFDVAQKFLDTPLRRLAVVEDGKLLGQISRRDVLRAEKQFSASVKDRIQVNPPAAQSQTDQSAQPGNVSSFMDRNARTTTEDVRFLDIARVFLDTPYRRLPVLRDGRLVGQISRRDVLKAANDLLAVPTTREQSLLYLSSLVDRKDAPIR